MFRYRLVDHAVPAMCRSDKRDGYTSGARRKIYDLISEYALHASYQRISLTVTGITNLAQAGPFFDEKKLAAWLHEMAMHLSDAPLVLVSNREGNDMKLEPAIQQYLEVAKNWGQILKNQPPGGASAAQFVWTARCRGPEIRRIGS